MNEFKWERRDRKIQKRRNGMRVDGRSIFVIRDADRKRSRRHVPDYRKDKLSED